MTTTEPRTAAATRAKMRISEEKFAERLRDRGWICISPDSEAHGPIMRAWIADDAEREV